MPTLNYDRVKRDAPGAHPFDDFKNCFGDYIAQVDPAGDPDLFALGVAMARQGFIPHKGSTTTQSGNYEFKYAPDKIAWGNRGHQ